MHPRQLFIKDFTYTLPNDRIAHYPLTDRSSAKLLVYSKGLLNTSSYSQLPEHLPANTHLVFNNSRVVEARMIFYKPSGGKIEIFALEPVANDIDITQAMNTCGSLQYRCMVGGAKSWKQGMVLEKQMQTPDGIFLLTAKQIAKSDQDFIVHFSWEPAHLPFAQVLHYAGFIPIPPYLQRQSEESDKTTYQTVYASADGSVAAPTAGLHFTPPLLQQLSDQKINASFLTLHVGAGTFLPVKSETIEDHSMHAEFLEADIPLLKSLISDDFIIPVGTTAMRTLESLYWMGVKCLLEPNISLQALAMQQWEVYDNLLAKKVEKSRAIEALIEWMQMHNMQQLIIKTHILIAPGYQFGICKGLITNFHQPQSTLLLLVAALVGDKWKQIYQYALDNNYRFLSYGDGSLLLP